MEIDRIHVQGSVFAILSDEDDAVYGCSICRRWFNGRDMALSHVCYDE
jgi:hypothetical protein